MKTTMHLHRGFSMPGRRDKMLIKQDLIDFYWYKIGIGMRVLAAFVLIMVTIWLIGYVSDRIKIRRIIKPKKKR